MLQFTKEDTPGSKPRVPLRFGLLLDGREIPEWQAQCLEKLIECGNAELIVAVINSGAARKGRKYLFRNGLYYVLRTLLMRPKCWRKVSAERWLKNAKIVEAKAIGDGGPWCRFDELTVELLRQSNLDFVLRFGFDLIRGEILDVARYGVWSFHHGDIENYRGRPAGFWEMLHGQKIVGVTLQKLTSALDGGVVLQRGWYKVEPWSLSKTLENSYQGSVMFPAQVCSKLCRGWQSPSQTLPSSKLGPVYTLPRNAQVTQLLARMLGAFVLRWWRAAFLEKRWNIGWREDSRDLVPALDGKWNWLGTMGARGFVADPFIVPNAAEHTVLCELLEYRQRRGVIAAVPLSDKPDNNLKIVISENSHLSYPCIATADGHKYCIPEQSGSGKTFLYELSADLSVRTRHCIFEDYAALDPTLFQYDGRWWIFCTRSGPSAMSLLDAFYAEHPLGPWHPHAANPIVADIRSARPAGSPLMRDGVYYRVGQDCSERYGGAISVQRICKLTPDEYVEEFVAQIVPGRDLDARDGVHTISTANGITVIDGYREVVNPFAWWRRLILRLHEAG